MTLVLGIRCSDGIVAGADSMFAVGAPIGRSEWMAKRFTCCLRIRALSPSPGIWM